MTESIQDKVIKLIPSENLKTAIRETGYQLSDIALLTVVYKCAPDFDTRIEYLKLLRDIFSGEIKEYTERIIETQRKMLDDFKRNEPDVVFELHIKETPDSYDERYLCRSYDDALKMIFLFYQEYESAEEKESRYYIEKRRVLSAESGVFAEDYIEDMHLLPNNVVYSVSMDECRAEIDCDGLCIDCDKCCVHSNEIPYPRFVDDSDVIRYREYGKKECFGFVHHWDDAPTSEYYVIPLDSEQIRYHDFENAFYAHEHIAAVFVEKCDVNELPEKMKNDYFAYLEYFKNK